MKTIAVYLLIFVTVTACTPKTDEGTKKETEKSISGTWKLIKGTLIEKGDTVVTSYDKNISFIKIINDTHFSFLQHDLKKGKEADSIFVAGGGKYTLKDSTYTEFLEYCSAREWEGNDFHFTVRIEGDTLTQTGVEKIPGLNVDRVNIEKYVREIVRK
ncbi:lipocalin-like domain-containing protein [Dyadobacter sp. CY323]|uniref:lipocalin-like domain-containing protein n=1 Tax=Dyadobacter sp. CY323 TaxID=2907302 RepID=UPI001F2D88EA|nr:lipocalin-like domain-containing protein [Dyadobacter sp. CY323]MCE6987979.1 lipocalin-like domain-containing protein [Dyadobacter sp. CY323]